MNLIWNASETPVELHELLRTLGDAFPIREDGEGINLRFEFIGEPDVLRAAPVDDKTFLIAYGSLRGAARGVGYALSQTPCDEVFPFSRYGILLDASRTAVIRVDAFKNWLRKLALLGYNVAMIYTKDAYQVPGETYFGYMRGAYSVEEMREIDAYAKKLGIEMVASIQALGHVEPVLRWPANGKLRDTDNVLMVDSPDTYALLDKMIGFWAEALGADRIHLGMDETHDLGRGRYMDQHGYERGFDLYNRHLKRVCEICEKYRLKPMIWSDMYFRMGNKNQNYYDLNTVIPDDVRDAIAPDAELWYWDYYHRDAQFYSDMIAMHRRLGKNPRMASGIWTWVKLWYDHAQTVRTAGPCIEACCKEELDEVIFTMWGDDGAYCEFDSAFAGMAWTADYAYNRLKFDEERIERMFGGIFGTSWRMQKELGDLDSVMIEGPVEDHYAFFASSMLWDDPLMGIVWREWMKRGIGAIDAYRARVAELRQLVADHRADEKAGHLNHAWNICNVLERKICFRRAFCGAWETRDAKALAALRDEAIPELIEALEELKKSFRHQWMRSYKVWGLEVMQIKLAGLQERYRETARRISEYCEQGKNFDELDVNAPVLGQCDTRYRMIATGGWFI